MIPAKILKNFDFTEYEVSKEGFKEITGLFALPIINLPYESEIVLKNADLYETLVFFPLFSCY